MESIFREIAKEITERHYRVGDQDYLEERIYSAINFYYKLGFNNATDKAMNLYSGHHEKPYLLMLYDEKFKI
jgi:hypothetical protein